MSRWGLVIAVLAHAGVARAIDVQPQPGWQEATRSDDIAIFYREDATAKAREFQAVIDVDATPKAVYDVVTDVEAHPKFIPFTKSSKIVERLNAREVIAYQVLSPPLVSDRDYYLHIKVTPGTSPTESVWKSEWFAVPEYGPEQEGLVRMRIAQGTWLFTPLDGGTRTRITYTSLTAIGGSIPEWIANRSSLSVLPKMLHAIRKRLVELGLGH